jgi:hypothetical protein
MNQQNVNRFFEFIHERYLIYVRKRAGKPKPWTEDKILQQYRFCNVYRELDTVTIWIAENWREPCKNDKDLWFAMCVARFVNWPETLEELGYPVPWDPGIFKVTLNRRAIADKKVFTGAYIIPATGPKINYVADKVLTPIWKARRLIRPKEGDQLKDFFARLNGHNGFGSFMTAQVVADIKYVEPLKSASDWIIWASSGPGSRRGLNRVCGRPKDSHWTETEWREKLSDLLMRIAPEIEDASMPLLHAQDLQNCLCEFDKYERVRLGEGRPRSKYPGV